MARHDPIEILATFKEEPPPIDYVLPNMIAGSVGGLVSPGGAGKSMLALQLATEIGAQVAGGVDLLGLGPLHTGRVLYLPAEDPTIAIKHRLHALGSYLTADQRHAVAEGFTIQPLVGSAPNIMEQKWFDAFLRGAEGTRLMIFDTLRRFHYEDENLSGPMAEVIGRMELLAAETGCSILFLHHASKAMAISGQGDQQQASRGSSVLVDNVRWSSYLAGMTRGEAENWGVDVEQRSYFVRFGISKGNYGPPFQERWLRRHEGGVLKAAVFELPKKGRRREEA